MTPRLTSLPYEVLSYIIEYVRFEDVISLARTCKQLQFLEREDKICKKVLEVRALLGMTLGFFRAAYKIQGETSFLR